METKRDQFSSGKLAGVGLIFILLPLYFTTAAILKYEFGIGFLFDPLDAYLSNPQRLHIFNLISPIVFLGGLLLALGLNLFAVFGANFRQGSAAILSAVRERNRFLNVAIVLMSGLLLTTLLGYVFLENFTRR